MCAFKSASFTSARALATASRASAATTGERPGSWPTSRTATPRPKRSEEHTSELQSRLHLVCRLLLEKKKKPDTTHHNQPRHPHPRLLQLKPHLLARPFSAIH